MSQSIEDFYNEIEHWVSEDELDKALLRLKEGVKERGLDTAGKISILQGQLKNIRDTQNLGLSGVDGLDKKKNRLRKSIIDLAKEIQSEYANREESSRRGELPLQVRTREISKSRIYISLLVTGVGILILLLYFGMMRPQKLYGQECESLKNEARTVLGQVIEKHRTNVNQYDDLRYIAIEEDLKNHIDLTTCDSLDRIKASIEFAREFIKTK
jgi:hypothetical protein